VSTIVILELRYGFAKSKTAKSNAAALELFLNGGIPIARFDAEDATIAGALKHRMEAKGKPMGPYDLQIAAHALRNGATLVTRDAAFSGVKGLRAVDWTV
jgi:tRNA(fMet)-specific endonuclease VapC